ncbi:hypothetical protein BCR35DRAFT_309183 [Leucosporidium creatinivorum]|uniref:F-box domain-containing protein n=1 Tax=Leucosporidium creatinivorum TaxID=106004 RepID=A0A1Y2DP12_9BASI|nr:hypothetical protein BCR35DRAFT_309183 [Leucosporidium creatinivorum]
MADTEQPTLPPELLTYILTFLSPQDSLSVPTLLACSLVSSSFLALARHSAVWRPHAHWKRGTLLLQPNEDAYLYYKRRSGSDLEALKDVNTMASSGVGRLPLLERIRTTYGEEVVEALAGKLEGKGETWMTCRYWSEETRKGIARDIAVQIWKSIQNGELDEAVGFERGAAAFAAFRGADPFDVLERYEISRHQPLLDALAISTERLTAEAALPQIARDTCRYMRELGLKPANSQQFHHIDNHFLNLVWDTAVAGASRGTLPMSLVAIFCALLRRLPASYDVQARPIGFPGLLLAGVANRGQENWIYVNVFSGGDVLSRSDLSSLLGNMGGGMSLQPEFLRPATAKEMCHRISRNILTSVRTADDPHPNDPLAATASLYAVATSLFILSPPEEPVVTYANWMVQLAQAEFSSDVSFLENEVIGTYRSPGRMAEVAEICEAIRDEDAGEMSVVKSREGIIWRLGHVFRHRLFGYIGVIRGYDLTCEASEQWIQAMQVDRLAYGRHQPFYHVLVDGSSRYVAQENITNDDSVPESAFNRLKDNVLVGRYFRKPELKEGGRWGFAVSEEVRRMYPDG